MISLISWLISIRALNSYIIQTGEEVETREIFDDAKGRTDVYYVAKTYLSYI